jgi:hypothetical protein
MTPSSLILGISLLGIANMFNSGVYAYMIGAGGCMLFNFGLNNLLWQLGYRYVAYKFFAVWFVAQPVFFFLCLLIFPNYFEADWAQFLPVEGRIYTLFASFCIVPLMAVLYAWFLDKISTTGRQEIYNFAGQRVQKAREFFRLPKLGADFDAMLIVAALITTSIWVTTLSNTNVIFFFLRVLNRGLVFAPFVAGLYWNRNRLVQAVWIITLAINLGLAFVTGNRGYGFFPAGYYAIGFILQQATRAGRVSWFALGIAGLIPLIIASGVVNVLRDDVGRTTLQTLDIGEVINDIPSAISTSLEKSTNTWDPGEQNALWTGLARMVDWSLLAVPNMTPQVVPYRGYGDLPQELEAMLSIPGLGIFPDLSYDSKGLAIPYGFTVNSGYDENSTLRTTSSVPFNIIADSWSRGGIVSVVMQVGLAILALTFAEKICYRFLLSRSVGLFVLGRMVVVGLGFWSLSVGIFSEAIRQLALTLTFTVFCVGLLMALVKAFLGTGAPAMGPPPGPMERRPPPPRPGPLGPRAHGPSRA